MKLKYNSMKRYVTLLIFISCWLCCVSQFPEVGRMEYKKMPGKILGVNANIAFIAAMRQKQVPCQLRVRDGGLLVNIGRAHYTLSYH